MGLTEKHDFAWFFVWLYSDKKMYLVECHFTYNLLCLEFFAWYKILHNYNVVLIDFGESLSDTKKYF